MGIFLRQSHNVKPPQWGSFADVQYAIRVNSEKIYDCDPDDDVLVMPLFWGLPPLDYSGYNNHGTNHGATYKDGSLDFDGGDDYVSVGSLTFSGDFTISGWIKVPSTWTQLYPNLLNVYTNGDYKVSLIPAHDSLNDRLYFVRKSNATTVHTVTTVSAIPVGYRHITIVSKNGIGATSYVDGLLDTFFSDADSIGDITGTLRLGSRVDGAPTCFFNNIIDEVRISKATRSADQIALFNDNKYGLYQKVGRPIWSIPAVGVTIPIFMQNMRGSFNSPGTRGGFIN